MQEIVTQSYSGIFPHRVSFCNLKEMAYAAY